MAEDDRVARELSRLESTLRNVAASALRDRRVKPSTLGYLPATISLRQLAEIRRHSLKLPRQPLEVPGIPFDRFMLHYSPTYRRVRRLAKAFGIRYTEGFSCYQARVDAFAPDGPAIAYTAIEPELEWMAAQPPSIDVMRHARVVKDFTASVAHETIHYVLYRLIGCRPAEMRTRAAATRYLHLIESAVVTVEACIAMELGEVGRPLQWAGLIYRKAAPARPPHRLLHDPDTLRTFLVVGLWMLENRSTRYQGLERRFRAAGRAFRPHPAIGFQIGFIERTSPNWLKRYFANGGRLRLPARTGLPKRIDVRAANSAQLLKDDATLTRVQRVLLANFG